MENISKTIEERIAQRNALSLEREKAEYAYWEGYKQLTDAIVAAMAENGTAYWAVYKSGPDTEAEDIRVPFETWDDAREFLVCQVEFYRCVGIEGPDCSLEDRWYSYSF